MAQRHSRVRWIRIRGHDKPRLMGVASHRSFPGGIDWHMLSTTIEVALQPTLLQKNRYYPRESLSNRLCKVHIPCINIADGAFILSKKLVMLLKPPKKGTTSEKRDDIGKKGRHREKKMLKNSTPRNFTQPTCGGL